MPFPFRSPTPCITQAVLPSQLINLTRSNDSEDNLIAYPSTLNFLTNLHAMQPLCNYPQYYDKLVWHGIIYVDSIFKLKPAFFSDIIGILVPEVSTFLRYTKQVMRRTEKGETKCKIYHACAIKKEEVESGEGSINVNKENVEPTSTAGARCNDWEF